MDKIRDLFGYPRSLYNCSGKSVDEWMKTGEKWPRLGMVLMGGGLVYLVLYLLAIYAILQLKLTKNPCYQIMLCIIFADIANLFANSFFAGHLFSIGAVFCMDPFWMYVEGCFNNCAWSFAAFLYVVLAINRFVAVLGSFTASHHLQRIPLFVWLLMAFSWSFYLGVLHKPMPYNSRLFLCFYIPFIEDPVVEMSLYENIPHTFNNLIFAVLICLFYSMIALVLVFREREEKISKRELNALIQAVLITAPAMIGSVIYIYLQFTNKSSLGWAIFAQFVWQTVSGTGAIIYLTLNHSVRGYLFNCQSRVQTYNNESTSKGRRETATNQEGKTTGNRSSESTR